MVIVSICRILAALAIFSDSGTGYELFSIGCQLELDGRVEEAIVHYYKAKELSPESPEIYLSLANALYKVGRFDEGIAVADQGITATHDTTQMYYSIAIGLLGKRNFKGAIDFYEKSLVREPGNIDIYESLSILYEGTGDLKKARSILVDIPEYLKTSETYIRLGTLTGKLNDHGAAIDYYRKAFTFDTTDVQALIGIGTAFDILNVKDSAIYYYEMSLRDDSLIMAVGRRLVDLYTDIDRYDNLITMAYTILEINSQDVHIRRNLGFAYYKLGRLQEALQEFLITSRIDPVDTYSRFYAGKIYLDMGMYKDAREEIEQAISINADFIELWVYLAFIAMDEQDYESAIHALTEAAYRGADETQIYYLLGVIAEMELKNSDAYFYYHKALHEDPKNVSTMEALANLCGRIDKEDEAFSVFSRIIEVDTVNATALNYVGYTYAERNDSLDYALALVEQALSLDEDNGYYIDSRGWVFYQMGEYEKARDDLERAAAIVDDPVILEHLGDVYLKLNEPVKARENYDKALQLEPDNKSLIRKIKNMTDG